MIHSLERIGQEAVRDYTSRRELWATEDQEFARRAYAVFLTTTFLAQIQHALHDIGRTLDEWGNAGPERLMRFWTSIPSLNVEMELHTEMLRQKSKQWTTHDDRDIGFLSLAIPACHVVITERFWVDIGRRQELDSRYQTVLTSDLSTLGNQL